MTRIALSAALLLTLSGMARVQPPIPAARVLAEALADTAAAWAGR